MDETLDGCPEIGVGGSHCDCCYDEGRCCQCGLKWDLGPEHHELDAAADNAYWDMVDAGIDDMKEGFN